MDHNIRKYGRMYRRYLQEYRPDVWAELVRAGELSRHLVEIDTACYEQMAYLVSEMAKREGVTNGAGCGTMTIPQTGQPIEGSSL